MFGAGPSGRFRHDTWFPPQRGALRVMFGAGPSGRFRHDVLFLPKRGALCQQRLLHVFVDRFAQMASVVVGLDLDPQQREPGIGECLVDESVAINAV